MMVVQSQLLVQDGVTKMTSYRYKTGDRVSLKKQNYIVHERYYPNGYGFEGNREAYVVYPPGKKKSYAHHVWVYADDLVLR